MRIFIKPKEGLIVRHVEKLVYIIPPEGEWVELNSTWQRRINEGDVYIAEPPQPVKSKQSDKSKLEGDTK